MFLLLSPACILFLGDEPGNMEIHAPPSAADAPTFADLGDDGLTLAYLAGYGASGATLYVTLAVGAQRDAASGCPTSTTEGDVTVFDAADGCDAPSGTTWSGRAEATTAALDLGGDPPASGLSMTATSFSAGDPSGTSVWDGWMDQDSLEVPFHVEMDLTSRSDAAPAGEVRSELTVDCDVEGDVESCTWRGRGELRDDVAFDVDGESFYDLKTESFTGTMTLVGVDVLVFDLGPSASEGCVDYTLDGAPGTLCP